jgi:hypothetical protein
MRAIRRIISSPIYRRRWLLLFAWIAAAWAIYLVSSNLWYIEGRGYCWGSMIECYFPEVKP